VEVFDDLEAEEERLETILAGLDDEQWLTPSAAAGWSVCDVVLHLAQTEEAVVSTAAMTSGRDRWEREPGTLDELMDVAVAAERAAPAAVLERWREARRAAVTHLRTADPHQPLPWAAAPLKPRALATTRLAEHWAHGLDITGPLEIDFPDTDRLRHVAWLAHRTLPYAFALAGLEPADVGCVLTAPDGSTWEYGPSDAASTISGSAGMFCRVGAQRVDPARSGLRTTGPHGHTALALLRNYAT
jgi:uncharacterized protein (TIGR03084 family)